MLAFCMFQPVKVMLSIQTYNSIMTIVVVAEYLNVIERTIYLLTGDKKPPSFKVGVEWPFSDAHIDKLIREQPTTAKNYPYQVSARATQNKARSGKL